MAVTAFINRLKAASTGPSDQDLGLDFGMGSSQVVMSDKSTQSEIRSKYLSDPELSLE